MPRDASNSNEPNFLPQIYLPLSVTPLLSPRCPPYGIPPRPNPVNHSAHHGYALQSRPTSPLQLGTMVHPSTRLLPFCIPNPNLHFERIFLFFSSPTAVSGRHTPAVPFLVPSLNFRFQADIIRFLTESCRWIWPGTRVAVPSSSSKMHNPALTSALESHPFASSSDGTREIAWPFAGKPSCANAARHGRRTTGRDGVRHGNSCRKKQARHHRFG